MTGLEPGVASGVMGHASPGGKAHTFGKGQGLGVMALSEYELISSPGSSRCGLMTGPGCTRQIASQVMTSPFLAAITSCHVCIWRQGDKVKVRFRGHKGNQAREGSMYQVCENTGRVAGGALAAVVGRSGHRAYDGINVMSLHAAQTHTPCIVP